MDMKAEPGINISSVILGVAPVNVAEVSRQLAVLAGVEIHAAAEDGRMIVTIESVSEGATVDIFEAIRQMPGVISASLVYHQYESDPDQEA